MYQNENIKKIMAVHRRCNEVQFRMALQHLFEAGHQNFTNENVAAAKETIEKDTPENSIMTAGYRCQLVERAYELSKFPLWDLLLYIKLYVSIQGDDLNDLDEAEQALRTWNGVGEPQEWKDAVADPDLREEILRAMVEGHDTMYSRNEIVEAIRLVVEQQNEE